VATAPSAVSPILAAALARRDFLSPPVSAEFGFLGSYGRDWLGLQPRGVRNLGVYLPSQEETPGFLRLLQAGGVSYAVSLHEEGLEELVPVATATSPFAGLVRLSRVPDPLPLVHAVGSTRLADGLEALHLLASRDFDLRAEAVTAAGPSLRGDPSFAGQVVRRVDGPGHRVFEVAANAPAFVVSLDASDVGWRARVDGQATDVHRANVGFIGVFVPAGRHEVELSYRPRGLWAGLLASGAGLALVLGALAVRPRAEGRPPERLGTAEGTSS
jgi:hypothetical protein